MWRRKQHDNKYEGREILSFFQRIVSKLTQAKESIGTDHWKGRLKPKCEIS